ncbi:hypothetical protein EBS02_00285 [bacterium]|nr:hypothetical protein [bacterium]
MTTTNAGSVNVRSTRILSSEKSFSIAKLRDSIGTVARPNNWYAELTFGAGLRATLGRTAEDLLPNFSFRCERTTIPGRTVATVDDYGAGPSMKIAQDITYADIDMTILCSTDMQERYVFESWISIIVLRRGLTGAGLVNYYENYAEGNILTLYHLDDTSQIILKYELYDVYPVQISAMNLTWEENNTYQRFDVTMNYRDSIAFVPEGGRSIILDDNGSPVGGNLLDSTNESGSQVDTGSSGDEDNVGGSEPLDIRP